MIAPASTLARALLVLALKRAAVPAVVFVAGCVFGAALTLSEPAQADRKSDEARALERIARALEGKCKP